MGIHEWVAYGYSRGKFFERDAEQYGLIELHDIGMPDTVGALYPQDGSRQAQPLAWHGKDAVRSLQEARARRGGRTRLSADAPQHARPRLGDAPHERPHLGASFTRPRLQPDETPPPGRPRIRNG